MINRIRALTLAVAMAAFVAPAFAGEGEQKISEGFVTAFPAAGPMFTTTVTDQGLLDDIAKMGIELPAGTMVAVHNGRAYLVKDVRMPDGKMMFDRIQH